MLDVGREHRLVTPAIRNALTLRDGGCAFPGCDVRPETCEAHHIQPWWNGGATALQNLVLLCHHHHGLIEPNRESHHDQWSVHIAEDGAPEFTPPVRLQRFQQRGRPPDDPVATESDGVERQIELTTNSAKEEPDRQIELTTNSAKEEPDRQIELTTNSAGDEPKRQIELVPL